MHQLPNPIKQQFLMLVFLPMSNTAYQARGLIRCKNVKFGKTSSKAFAIVTNDSVFGFP